MPEIKLSATRLILRGHEPAITPFVCVCVCECVIVLSSLLGGIEVIRLAEIEVYFTIIPIARSLLHRQTLLRLWKTQLIKCISRVPRYVPRYSRNGLIIARWWQLIIQVNRREYLI